ncbi:MAG: hypothetical protein NTW96_15510 [Planctomycetia bacterium]|nr:hypothetical protein [Planctomycetia bacterium]
MSPVAQSVIQRLDATRQRWWLFTLLSTAVLATSLSMAVMLLFMLTDALVKFSQVVLAGMFLTWLAVTVALMLLLYRRLTRGQRSLEATARRVESQFPELGSNLINLVQLGEATGGGDPAFREAAIRQAAADVGRIPLEQAASRENRWRRFVGCMQTPRDFGESFALLAALVLVAAVCRLLIPTLGSAASRLLAPWTFVPSVGSVEIVEVTPGDVDVLIGTSLEITARINNPEEKPHEATAWITTADGQESDLPMTADAGQSLYTLTLPSVTQALTYRLDIGDSQTRIFTVGVREKPTIEEVEVTLHFPAYLGRADETVPQKQADLEAPQYTVAELRIRPSVPIAEGHIESDSRRYPGRV